MPDSATVTTSVGILSLMITPIILILAAASLISATTTRLISVMESMHELSAAFERHLEQDRDHRLLNEEQVSLMVQITRTTKRVRLMQVTVALLHFAVLAFVITSIGLGVDAASPLQLGLTPVFVGLVGALFLLASMLVLVYDAFIAVAATREEAQFTLRMTEHRAAQARHLPGQRGAPISWS